MVDLLRGGHLTSTEGRLSVSSGGADTAHEVAPSQADQTFPSPIPSTGHCPPAHRSSTMRHNDRAEEVRENGRSALGAPINGRPLFVTSSAPS